MAIRGYQVIGVCRRAMSPCAQLTLCRLSDGKELAIRAFDDTLPRRFKLLDLIDIELPVAYWTPGNEYEAVPRRITWGYAIDDRRSRLKTTG